MYLMRHGPKIDPLDFSGVDKNGINLEKTLELLSGNRDIENITGILASPMLRTQLTAKIAEKIFAAPVNLSRELSAYAAEKFTSPSGEIVRDFQLINNQRQIVKGPYSQTESNYYFLIPMFSSPLFKELMPNLKEMNEWAALREYAKLEKHQIYPFWTIMDLGIRGSKFLKRKAQNTKDKYLAISHSGIIEPIIAAGLNRNFKYVSDFIGERQWGFCEKAVCNYEGSELKSVEFRGGKITRK